MGKYTNLVLCLVSTCCLVSCGGSESPQSPPSKTPGSAIQEKLTDAGPGFSERSRDLTRKIMVASETLLQLGYFIDLATRDGPEGLRDSLCQGSIEKILYEKSIASLNSYTEGDIFDVEVVDCFAPDFGETFSGYMKWKVVEYNDSTLTFLVTFSDLSIKGNIISSHGTSKNLNISGEFVASIIHTLDKHKVDISQVNMGVYENSIDSYQIEDWSVVRTLDYQTGLYSIDSNGVFTDNIHGQVYNIFQDIPWVGVVFSAPHEGGFRVSYMQDDILYVAVNAEKADMSVYGYLKRSQLDFRWGDYLQGTYWSPPSSFYRFPNEPNVDVPSYYGVPPLYAIRGLYQDEPVRLLFSRPVKEAELRGFFDSEELAFQCFGAFVSYYGGYLEAKGNIVLVHSDDPLPTGWECSTGDIKVDPTARPSQSLVRADDILISNRAIARISAPSYFYSENDRPTLTVDGYFMNSEVSSVQWLDPGGRGILFDDPQSMSTTFSLPGLGDYEIRVALSSLEGVNAYRSAKIFSLKKSNTMLAINSDVGDFVGAGRHWLYHESDGEFNFSYQPDRPRQLVFEFLGETVWVLYLAVPDGVEFGPGSYQATRNFTSSYDIDGELTSDSKQEGFGALDFHGDMRGCNELDAEFDLLEFAIDESNRITQLAVNFVQRCQVEKPYTRVVLRYNSDYPMNN